MSTIFQRCAQHAARGAGAVLALTLFGAAAAQLVEPPASAASARSAADALTTARPRPVLRPAPVAPAPLADATTQPGLGQPVTPQIRIPIGKKPLAPAAASKAATKPETVTASTGDAAARCEAMTSEPMRLKCLDRLAKVAEGKR